MGILWRLGVLALQLAVLLVASYATVGEAITNQTWFFAGLLGVIINPQLLEPYYPKPGDVIGNSVIFLFLYAVSGSPQTHLGWTLAAAGLSLACVLAVLGLIGSRVSKRSGKFNFGFAARSVSQLASAQVIYTVSFFLALLDARPTMDFGFWWLSGAWALIMIVGNTNWQRVWTNTVGISPTCKIEGFIGPSILTVAAPTLPEQGKWIGVSSRSGESFGLVIKRIVRRDDVWGQIHVADQTKCEGFLVDGHVQVENREEPDLKLVGSVDAGSTDMELRFVSTQALEIGEVVGVPIADGKSYVLYQVARATIEHTDIQGSGYLFVRAFASQLGTFNRPEHAFRRHPWVPNPGAPVVAKLSTSHATAAVGEPPVDYEVIGDVIGTSLPVYLNLEAVSTGHLAILGMTKMGKSTFAERLARKLGNTRRVTILDVTGEYVQKKGFPRCDKAIDWKTAGVSVLELSPGDVPADRALKFINFLVKTAQDEYKVGQPFPRTVIIDEAHQFIPEPAGLGFNAPGRESAIAIGLLLMQIRKFGISVILISQRTAVVAKSALSQCENLVAYRSVDQTGLDYIEAVAGGDVRSLLPRLQQGQALAFGPAVTSELPVAVAVRQG